MGQTPRPTVLRITKAKDRIMKEVIQKKGTCMPKIAPQIHNRSIKCDKSEDNGGIQYSNKNNTSPRVLCPVNDLNLQK